MHGPSTSRQGAGYPLATTRGPFKGPRGPFKGSRGPFKGSRGPFKGPRGPSKGPWGPFKGSRGPFKGPRGPSKGPCVCHVYRTSKLPFVLILCVRISWTEPVCPRMLGQPLAAFCDQRMHSFTVPAFQARKGEVAPLMNRSTSARPGHARVFFTPSPNLLITRRVVV